MLSVLGRLGGLGAAAVVLCGCGDRPSAEAPGRRVSGGDARPVVYVTFHPLEYFASRIGGEAVEVVNPLPADADAATHQPSDEALLGYQQADLILVNGTGFEQWLESVSLPVTRVVDTTAGLSEEERIGHESMTHSHGPEGEHTHEGLDGHTWLDPHIAARQARAIAAALAGMLPDRADEFERRLEELEGDLAGLDESLRALAPRVEGAYLIASHPSYNYLSRRYGWSVHNLGLEPDVPLGRDEIDEVEHAAAHAPAGAVRIMLWEADPLDETARTLAERYEIRSVTFSPAEAERRGENYLSIMRGNVRRLEEALAGGGEG